jgi:phospholipid transport system substrate-binding protein
LHAVLYAIILLLTVLWFPPLTWAGAADDLKSTVDGIQAVLRSNAGPESNMRSRRDQLRRLLDSRFDFHEIARRSLGLHWKSLTSHEQREYVEAFRGLLEIAYVALIEPQATRKILYQRETRETDNAQVDTAIVTKMGDSFSVDYRMHLVAGAWKIYDVVIENISVVNNYRSQFTRVIAKSSYSELIIKLKEKQARASEIKWGGQQLASGGKNRIDESRSLIIAGLISSSSEKQFFSSPSR